VLDLDNTDVALAENYRAAVFELLPQVLFIDDEDREGNQRESDESDDEDDEDDEYESEDDQVLGGGGGVVVRRFYFIFSKYKFYLLKCGVAEWQEGAVNAASGVNDDSADDDDEDDDEEDEEEVGLSALQGDDLDVRFFFSCFFVVVFVIGTI
jgi:hypothetical protein